MKNYTCLMGGLTLALSACASVESGGTQTDGEMPDHWVSLPDAATPDAAEPDSSLPDSSVPDATEHDAYVPPPPADVLVAITADNAYGFGYGTSTQMANYFGGVENSTAGQIFLCSNGPEEYVVPAQDADAGDYLYIIGYADSAVTQGVIGQFTRDATGAPTVYTGQGDWEVCATGQNFSPGSGGPTLTQINDQILICNAGTGDPNTTSAGWVDANGNGGGVGALQVGEDNTTDRTSPTPGNEFAIVCNTIVDPEATWIWYNWDPVNIQWPSNGSPFIWPGGTNPDKQFLIFRLQADHVPTHL